MRLPAISRCQVHAEEAAKRDSRDGALVLPLHVRLLPVRLLPVRQPVRQPVRHALTPRRHNRSAVELGHWAEAMHCKLAMTQAVRSLLGKASPLLHQLDVVRFDDDRQRVVLRVPARRRA